MNRSTFVVPPLGPSVTVCWLRSAPVTLRHLVGVVSLSGMVVLKSPLPTRAPTWLLPMGTPPTVTTLMKTGESSRAEGHFRHS